MASSNLLDADSMAPTRAAIVARQIGGRPYELMEGVVDFPQSPYLPSSQKNSRRNRWVAMATPQSGGSSFDEPETQKRCSKQAAGAPSSVELGS